MLSIHKMVAGEGFRYLTRHVAVSDGAAATGQSVRDYYAASGNPPGRWLGQGLDALGRVDARVIPGSRVDERELAAVFRDGCDPVTGQPLGRHLKVAGYDLTFTAPKSASVLWGLGDESTRQAVAAAHEAAVSRALGFVETSVLRTRVGAGGVRQIRARGMVAAGFDHWDSRARDPNLHTHVVVANRVQGIDGVWRSVDGTTIHAAAVAVSELYDALLSDEVARRLPVSWSWRSRAELRNPALEIDGLDDELLAAFSCRSQAIAAAQERWAAEHATRTGRGPSRVETTRAREHLTRATRPVKMVLSLRELLTEWANRARALTGREPVDLAAAVLAGGYGRALHAHDVGAQVREQIVAAAVLDASTRRSVWSTWNLAASVLRASADLPMASPKDRFQLTDQLLSQASEGCIRLDVPAPDRPVRRGEERYTTAEMLGAEALLLSAATPTGTRRQRLALSPAAAARLAGLDEDQAGAVADVLASLTVLDVMAGPAGAGKTTTLAALADAWHASRGGEVIALAPSASAAHVLGAALGVRAETTAKWLHESVGPGALGRTQALNTPGFSGSSPVPSRERVERLTQEQDRWRLHPGALLLLDEASLADTRTLAHLTGQAEAVAGVKILLVGDPAQRGAIGAGGAFAMLVNRGPTAQLRTLRRFTHPWEARAVLALRHGSTSAIDTYAEHRRLHAGTYDELVNQVAQATATALGAGERVLAQAVDTATVTDLNQRIHTLLQDIGLVGDNAVTLADHLRAGVGDRVVSRRNDRRLTYGDDHWVRNGTLWRVAGVRLDGSLDVTDLDGFSACLPVSYVAAHVELGYATTTARSQGVTADVTHNLVFAGTTREDLYVAMSRGRATNHLYVAVDGPGTDCLPVEQAGDPMQILTTVLVTTRLETSATDTWDQHHPDRPLVVPLPPGPTQPAHALPTPAPPVLSR
ncbi:MAG TPA: MobF family relaxase [Propionicimonas sp.]